MPSSKPTAIEQGYLDQGYKLPEGWTWDLVAEHREKRQIEPIFVPLKVTLGIVAWGVPFIDGKPLKHSVDEDEDIAKQIANSRVHLSLGDEFTYAAGMAAAIRSALSERAVKAFRKAIVEDGAEDLFRKLESPCPVARG